MKRNKPEKHHTTCVVTDKALKNEIEAAVQRVPGSLKSSRILPWIGKGYGRGSSLGSKRILILGDSHYEWCRLCHKRGRRGASLARLTCYDVAAQLLRHPSRHRRHFPSIELAVMGYGRLEQDRRELWQSVAYANYDPMLVGLGPKKRPTAGIRERAQHAFPALLDALRPKIVFVLGEGVWGELPCEDSGATSLKKNGRKIYRCVYRLRDGEEVIACRLRHPRAGLGGPWHPVVMQALSAVADSRRAYERSRVGVLEHGRAS